MTQHLGTRDMASDAADAPASKLEWEAPAVTSMDVPDIAGGVLPLLPELNHNIVTSLSGRS